MGIYRVKALIPTPLPRVWEFIIAPRNQPLWVPYIKSVAGVDRPLQTGDRLTQWRRNFFRLKRVELLVEEVIPYRSVRLGILSAKGRPMDATATLSVEQAADPGATWVEEVLTLSLGKGPLVRGVQRWLLDPLFRLVVRHHSGRALRCLAERLAQGAGAEPGAEPGAAADGGGM
ncbi:MAG: SRPBCC family protein [Acidobacteria bacterium]|nr:SRPBCC family protein [Acidobacteriota bacterium]